MLSMATVKNFVNADRTLTPDEARMEFVTVRNATIMRATHQPGWRWSTHLKPLTNNDSCQIPHTGVVVSGHYHFRMDDGQELDLGPGDVHYVAAGHDAWVVGDEPCVILNFIPDQDG